MQFQLHMLKLSLGKGHQIKNFIFKCMHAVHGGGMCSREPSFWLSSLTSLFPAHSQWTQGIIMIFFKPVEYVLSEALD